MIEHFNRNQPHWRAMLHKLLDRDDIEEIVFVTRVDGVWSCEWSAVENGGLCMASMKLAHDVTRHIHEDE